MLVVVCGGGPAGATAAQKLAREGVETILLEKSLSRVKPCTGAIPSALVREFDIPDYLIERKLSTVALQPPSGRVVRFEAGSGYVGMISRDVFDTFLRSRAAQAGVFVIEARVDSVDATELGALVTCTMPDGRKKVIKTDCIIGADGANSFVGRKLGLVTGGLTATAIQERFSLDVAKPTVNLDRFDLHWHNRVSPDFHGWVFPKGTQLVIGTASIKKSAHVARLLDDFRSLLGIHDVPLERESAPMPRRPLNRWVTNRALLVGDAAGLSAGTGEGIYFAMKSGLAAAEAILSCAPDFREEKLDAAYRKPFLAKHGAALGQTDTLLSSCGRGNAAREAFVSMCADPKFQKSVAEAYLNRQPLRLPAGFRMRAAVETVKAMFGGNDVSEVSETPRLLLPERTEDF